MVLRAVILDVYNTIVLNDTDAWLETFREICETQRLPIAPQDLWTRWRMFEKRFRETRTNLEHPEEQPPFKTYQSAWRDAFVKAFDSLEMAGDADQAAQMSVDGLANRQPFEDTFTFLEHVARHWKVALLTNADNGSILPLVGRYGLSFDAVLTSEGLRAYKPTPITFRRALQAVGVSPQEALYVGDTLFDDVHGSKQAGMRAVWINRNGADRDPDLLPPDYEVTSLTELLGILDSLREVDRP